MVHAFGFNNQCKSWSCMGCSGRWWCGLWGDPPLSNVAHTSYNSHETLRYHTHTYIIILGPLDHWWWAWCKIMVTNTTVIAEHIWGVVGGHDNVCGVIHPCQTWSMPHITLIDKWDNISIHLSSSFYKYTTDEEHGSSSLFQKLG